MNKHRNFDESYLFFNDVIDCTKMRDVKNYFLSQKTINKK